MGGIVVTQLVVERQQLRQSLQERFIIFLLRLHPLYFAHGCQSRQEHIFHMFRLFDILCPEIRLRAQDVGTLFRSEHLRHRFKAINLFQGYKSTNCQRLIGGMLCLIIVEVAVVGGRHDYVVAQLCSLYAAAHAAPRHYRGVRCQLTFQNLIPSNDAATVVVQELFHAGGHIALQVMFCGMAVTVLQSQFLNASLTSRTFFPACLGRLVTTNMDVLRRKDLHHFGQHSLQKGECLLLAGAEHIVEHTPFTGYLIGTTGTTQLGISSQRCQHMTGQVHFGDDGDVPLLRIFYHLFQLLFGVESAMGYTVILARVAADHCFLTHGSLLDEFGISINFDAPSLVVGQVPVKAIDVV